jgi:hypothetical protein
MENIFINEESFNVSYDSTFTPTDTIINQKVNTTGDDRTLHQLKFVIENSGPLSVQSRIQHRTWKRFYKN